MITRLLRKLKKLKKKIAGKYRGDSGEFLPDRGQPDETGKKSIPDPGDRQ
jgi:hypothetical protein